MLAFIIAGSLSLFSCGGDNGTPEDPKVPEQNDSKEPEKPSEPDQPTSPEEPDQPNKPTDPDTPPAQDNPLSPLEQKERMDAIAQEFMRMTPASDFKTYADLGNHMYDICDNYNWDAVEDWAQKCWDAARQSTGNKITESQGSNGTYVYTDYTALLLASNFTGYFYANKNKWVQEPSKANDLQFSFTDKYGRTCNLKVETSGNVTKVYASNLCDYTGSDYSQYPYYKWTKYYDRTQCTIGVPENIIVTLTQDGTQMVKTTVKVNLASLTGINFDISKGSFTASALIELNNGYSFSASQVAYSGNQKASVNYDMSKNGTTLATVSVAADVSGIPSCNVEAFSRKNFDLDDYNTDNATAKNALVKIDILGKLQLQGVIKDARKYYDYLNKADENDNNENMFKQWLNTANDITEIGLFYNNTSLKQAAMKFDAFADKSWGGKTYWEMEPVLVFFDGSSNSMFDVFFNDTDFKATINAFQDLINKYEDLID